VVLSVSPQYPLTDGSKKCWGARHSQPSRRQSRWRRAIQRPSSTQPRYFLLLVGGRFFITRHGYRQTPKTLPTDSPKYRLFRAPFAFVSISPYMYPAFHQIFILVLGLRLSSSFFICFPSFFFFRPGFRSLSFRLRLSVFVFVFYRQFILSLKMQNVKLFYFSSNRSILK